MSDEVSQLQISQRDKRARKRRTQGQSEQSKPIVSTSSVDLSSVDNQTVIDTTPNLAFIAISQRTSQPIENMANPVSTVRHNVFRGLGEDPDVHINRFNSVAQADNQAADVDRLRVFPATLDGYASDWYAQFSCRTLCHMG